MKQYFECNTESLQERKIYIFGSGNWGKRCFSYLKKNNIHIEGFFDNNNELWGQLVANEVEILSPQIITESFFTENIIIVAMQNRGNVLKQLEKLGVKNFYIFVWNKIFYSKDKEVFGYKENSSLLSYLNQHKLYIYGTGKYLDDFKYVFDNLKMYEVHDSDEIPYASDNKNGIVILCDFNYEEKEQILSEKGYVYNKNYIKGEELFCLLDDIDDASVTIPSAMMHKTLHAPMVDQVKCLLPFKNIQVSSRFSVHCCCSDWGSDIGNLENNTLEEVWNSNSMKIFRLSIINRTYSFCNSYNCVHMIMDPKPTTERMPIIKTDKYPQRLEIGIDRTCNLYCESCRKDICVEQGKKRELIEKIKNQIIESGWLDNVDRLLLGGQGEVFFSQIYRDIMYKNAMNRKTLDLRTNGVLINGDELDKLEEIYNELSIIVSIDAATKDTYKKLRRSKDENAWDKLQVNLQELSKRRKNNKLSFFQINMCVQMDNYLEMIEFIRMGIELGVDKVYLTPIRNWGTYTDDRFKEVEIFDKKKKLKSQIAEVLKDPIFENPVVQCSFE